MGKEDAIKMDFKEIILWGCEVDGTGSRSYQVADFRISDVEPLDSGECQWKPSPSDGSRQNY
jgi:hypothetical protein